jgi:hypothetical protein
MDHSLTIVLRQGNESISLRLPRRFYKSQDPPGLEPVGSTFAARMAGMDAAAAKTSTSTLPATARRRSSRHTATNEPYGLRWRRWPYRG